MDTKDLGRRIKEAREHAGLTQASLAALIGVKQPTICAWELGDEPRFGNLAKLAEVLGLTVPELMTYERPAAAGDSE